jgi:hypothetical protein
VGSQPSPDDLGSAASLLHALADAPGVPPSAAALHPGQLVSDKYRVVGPIGAGGMGVVYLARDLRLERDVAIKLGRARSASALARVEREARALARVSHPNIVVVYEVGEIDGRVFVAMEYVSAGTARAWLARRPRTPREILALYCAAGEGLAAAHAAGIVHRDFKPDNVLVGDDGRPRVADFGLAREGLSPVADLETSAEGDAPTITRAGAIVGTPAYMPPEQQGGGVVDTRADQYAFSVALWEALYGLRPFGDATPSPSEPTTESAPPRTSGARARASSAVPRHVQAALRRGLRADPADRWPTLAALLAELRRDPARRRRNLAIAGGGAAAAALAAAIVIPRLVRSTPVADPCGGGEARIAVAWSPAHADAVRAAFAAVHLEGESSAVVDSLDQYAKRWIAADRAVCEAAGSVSDRVRERAAGCLDARRDDLAAARDLLDSADYDTATRAGEIVARLAPPERCTNDTIWIGAPARAGAGAPKHRLCAAARAAAVRAEDGASLPQGISLWEGDFQAHVIERSGDEVWAAYEHDNGLFYGTIQGGVLKGWWCERPHHFPADNGTIEMRFAHDPNGRPKLDGRYRYGDTGDWHDDWDDDPAPWSSCSEETAARVAAFDWQCPMPSPRPRPPPR